MTIDTTFTAAVQDPQQIWGPVVRAVLVIAVLAYVVFFPRRAHQHPGQPPERGDLRVLRAVPRSRAVVPRRTQTGRLRVGGTSTTVVVRRSRLERPARNRQSPAHVCQPRSGQPPPQHSRHLVQPRQERTPAPAFTTTTVRGLAATTRWTGSSCASEREGRAGPSPRIFPGWAPPRRPPAARAAGTAAVSPVPAGAFAGGRCRTSRRANRSNPVASTSGSPRGSDTNPTIRAALVLPSDPLTGRHPDQADRSISHPLRGLSRTAFGCG